MKPLQSRVCIVSPVHWKSFMGGAQYQIKCLLDHLQGFDELDLHYVARRIPNDPVLDGIHLHRIGNGGSPPSLGYAVDAPDLYKLLHKLHPSVIYQRIGCAYTGIAAFYARRNGAKLIWHVSSDADLDRAMRTPDRNLVRQFLDNSLLAYGIRTADRIVVQTRRQAQLLTDRYARSADAVIANFHPAPIDVWDADVPRRIVWVANFKPLKRPEVFLRLASRFRDDPQVRFIMIGAAAAGKGDSDWNRSIMNQIARATNVEYLGPLSQDEVNAHLNGAYAFVNTSLYEGFPNTFIQAWLRRVPVVSMAVNPDNVLDGGSIGVHAPTEVQLEAAVRRLLENESLRDQMARLAGAYALQFHSMKNAARLAQMIREAGMSDRPVDRPPTEIKSVA